MQNEKFKVRAFGYEELAQLYFPYILKKNASAQLRRWIKQRTKVFANASNSCLQDRQSIVNTSACKGYYC
jgi:hypothetical protein